MGSADFLFTPPVQRVLAATLSDPARSFTMEELLQLAGKGRGNTRRQVESLLAFGVLLEEPRRGRVRSIRANTRFFLYPELASIARKSFAVVEPLKQALAPFAGQIEHAFVFGSVAKGSDSQRSDIDLAVIGHVPLVELSEALHNEEQSLGRAIHLSLYAPEEWRELVARDQLVAQIAQGPKLELLPDGQTA